MSCRAERTTHHAKTAVHLASCAKEAWWATEAMKVQMHDELCHNHILREHPTLLVDCEVVWVQHRVDVVERLENVLNQKDTIEKSLRHHCETTAP